MLYPRSAVDDLDHKYTGLFCAKAKLKRQCKNGMSHVMNIEIVQPELDSRERAERLKQKKAIVTVSTSRKVSVREKREANQFATRGQNSRSPRRHFKPKPPESRNDSFIRRSNF